MHRHLHQDDVPPDAADFSDLARDHAVGEFGRLLRGGDFGGVQAGVDPHDRFASAASCRASRGVACPSASCWLISR